MKIEDPEDIQGRLIAARCRARALAASLLALGRDDDGEAANSEVLDGLAEIASDLADEIEAIDRKGIEHENRRTAALCQIGGRALSDRVEQIAQSFPSEDAAIKAFLLAEHNAGGVQ